MKKVINPVVCDVYGGKADGFAKIVFENGRLSICGVVGPTRNGNCKGSAGQCTEAIRSGEPKQPWTREMVDKLCRIWDEWHLNDMRPYCPHQKALGWRELAGKEVTLYHYRLTRDALRKQEKAKNLAIDALKKGETFTPTSEQTKFANLPYSITTAAEISKKEAENYEPQKPLFDGDKGPTEKKQLGWLYEKDHPDGILCKPCPICGYKYGTSWLTEEVPSEVIDWLFSLPDSEIKPAWV